MKELQPDDVRLEPHALLPERPKLRRGGSANRPLQGAAGRPLTDEMKEKLAEGRQRVRESGDWNGGRTKTKFTQREVTEHHLERLMPKALQVLELALDGAIERETVDSTALKAAIQLYEQKHGKATQTQKVEQNQVTKIEYVAAPFNFSDN